MKNLKITLSIVFITCSTLTFSQSNIYPSTGNVGIGTLSPSESLHIKSGTIQIDALKSSNPLEDDLILLIVDTIGKIAGMSIEDILKTVNPSAPAEPWYTTGNNNVLTHHWLGSNNAAPLSIRTNGLERYRIDEEGAMSMTNNGLLIEASQTPLNDWGMHLTTTGSNANLFGIVSNVERTDAKPFSAKYLNSTESFYVKGNGDGFYQGRLGLGTSSPQAKLSVSHNDAHGGLILNRESALTSKSQISFRQQGIEKWTIGVDIDQTNNHNFFIYDGMAGQARLFINPSGQVGIGTTNTHGFKLAVNGQMIAEEVRVLLNADWPDYVFADDYKLTELDDLERFIETNNHLPGIPSAKEVKENGIAVGEMNALLLEKIEELTLYMIELKKENDQIKQELAKLQSK